MGSKSTYSNDLNKNKAHTLKRPSMEWKKIKGRLYSLDQKEILSLPWICDFYGSTPMVYFLF